MSDLGDSFTETTHKSWFSRIGGAITGVLIGLILLAGSSVLLFWNEGRAVQTERSLAEGRTLVVDVDAARVDASNEGKLVHVNGDVKAAAALRDAEFGVAANGLRLVRSVEMYQWKEESHSETHKTLGGGEDTVTTYTYRLTWSGSPINSSRFRRPDGHNNPPMRFRDASTTARDATLGAFRPGEAALQLLPANERVQLEPALADTLRGRVSGPLQVADGRLYLGADPGAPRAGDHRISFTIAPNGPASFVGRQSGAGLAAYQTKSGDRLLMARSGLMTAPAMFKVAEDQNRILTWVLRAVGVVAMLIGFVLLLMPLSVVADVIPLIGSIVGAGAFLVALVCTFVVAPAIIALAWLWYRPLVSLAVIIVGFGVAYGFRMLAARRPAATARPA